MPLPFLTADRDLDLDDRCRGFAPPLPHDEPDHWRRPYRPGPWRVGAAAVLLLLASFVLFSAMIIAMAGSLPGAAACAVLGARCVIAVRAAAAAGRRVGQRARSAPGGPAAYDDRALERQSPPCAPCQQPVRWLGLPRTVQGQALILDADAAASRCAAADHRPQRATSCPARRPSTGPRTCWRPGRRSTAPEPGPRTLAPTAPRRAVRARPRPARSAGPGFRRPVRACCRAGRWRAASPCGRAGCPGRRGRRPRAGTSSASRPGASSVSALPPGEDRVGRVPVDAAAGGALQLVGGQAALGLQLARPAGWRRGRSGCSARGTRRRCTGRSGRPRPNDGEQRCRSG